MTTKAQKKASEALELRLRAKVRRRVELAIFSARLLGEGTGWRCELHCSDDAIEDAVALFREVGGDPLRDVSKLAYYLFEITRRNYNIQLDAFHAKGAAGVLTEEDLANDYIEEEDDDVLRVAVELIVRTYA